MGAKQIQYKENMQYRENLTFFFFFTAFFDKFVFKEPSL